MKFKNIKKKPKKAKSPSNSRIISSSVDRSEGFKFSLPKINSARLIKLYRGALKIFVVFVFIIAVIIVGYEFQKNIETKRDIDLQREILTKDLNFWENFISKNQNYRDAYFQISILEYRLGNISKARMYAEKGLSLDPNSQEGKRLKDFLGKAFYF